MISRRWPGAPQRFDGVDVESTNLAELGCGVILALAQPTLHLVTSPDAASDRSTARNHRTLSGRAAAPVHPGEPFPAA